MNFKRVVISLCLISSLSILSACSEKAKTSQELNQPQAKNVNVITVKKSDILVENEFAGEVKAADETGVISKSPGKVKEVSVKVGDSVHQGDVLFTLDGDDLRAQLASTQAAVTSAKLALDKVSGSGLEQQLLQAQSEYNTAQMGYDDANRDYLRAQSLFNSGSSTQKDLDDSKSKRDLANNRLATASKNYDLLKNASGPQSIDIAKAQLEQAKGSEQLINVQLNNLVVRAPITGTVTAKNINVGEGVSAASPAMVISTTSDLKVEMNIPENLISKFSKGQNLQVTIQSLNNKVMNGIIDLVAPSMDAATKNFKVKIKLVDQAQEVKPGMQAKITLAVESKNNVITIPNHAYLTEKGVYYVLVVKDGKVVKTPIKLGLCNEKVSEVTQGLSENDSIVIEGQSFLSDGENVKILVKS